MKRFLRALLGVITIFICVATFVSCGNRDVFDTNYTFDTAIIGYSDGTSERVSIRQWRDYDGEQLQIITTDGRIILVSSTNCELIKEAR